MSPLPIFLLLLIVQQLGNCRSSNHCQVSRKKIKAEDIVRTINQSPRTTWKVSLITLVKYTYFKSGWFLQTPRLQASTYGLKEIDLEAMARAKLGLKMDDDQTISAAEMRKMKKEARGSTADGVTYPENFSWATSNRTKCPISSIREQSNCASGWVRHDQCSESKDERIWGRL